MTPHTVEQPGPQSRAEPVAGPGRSYSSELELIPDVGQLGHSGATYSNVILT